MADTSLNNTNRDLFNYTSHFTSKNCHFIQEFPDSEIPWKSRGVEYQFDFVAYIKPTPEEQWVRELVIARYQSVIYQLWHYCKVDVCGSFRTGLYLPTSDIDLVIFGTWPMTPLDTLKDHLEQSGLTSSIKVLSKATVPILKLTDKETNIQIDISFNMSNSIKAVNLIKEYLCVHPCLHHLVLVLKQFLFQRELNEVWTGGLGSYALIIICVSFLQHHISPGSTIDDVNLGTLLVEFLELYSRRFNYNTTAISVRNGGSYEQKHRLFKFSTAFCIEDPLDCNNDLGRRSYAIAEVKQAFEYAFVVLSASVLPHYQFLHTSLCSSILGKIIRISPEVIDHRQKICEFAQKSFVNLSIQYPTLSALNPSLNQQISKDDDNPQVLVTSSDLILASTYFNKSKIEGNNEEELNEGSQEIPITIKDFSDENEVTSTCSSGAPSTTSQCSSDDNDENLLSNSLGQKIQKNSSSDFKSSTVHSKPNISSSQVIRNSNSISSHTSVSSHNSSKELTTNTKRSRRQIHNKIRRSINTTNEQDSKNTTLTNLSISSSPVASNSNQKDNDEEVESNVSTISNRGLTSVNNTRKKNDSSDQFSARKHPCSSSININPNNQNSYHSSSSDQQQQYKSRPFARSTKRKRMNNNSHKSSVN